MIMIIFSSRNNFTINSYSGKEYEVLTRYLSECKKLTVIEKGNSYWAFEIPFKENNSNLYIVNGNNVDLSIYNSEINFFYPTSFSFIENNSEIVLWLSHKWNLRINAEDMQCNENIYNHYEIGSIRLSVKCVRSGDIGPFIQEIPASFSDELKEIKRN